MGWVVAFGFGEGWHEAVCCSTEDFVTALDRSVSVELRGDGVEKVSGAKLPLAAHYANAMRFICKLRFYSCNKHFGVDLDAWFNISCGVI